MCLSMDQHYRICKFFWENLVAFKIFNKNSFMKKLEVSEKVVKFPGKNGFFEITVFPEKSIK